MFSFGSVLYEMIAGQQAFKGPSRSSTRCAVIHADPAPIRESAQLSSDLTRIVHRCLKKDPDARSNSIVEVKQERERLQQRIKVQAQRRREIAVVSILIALVAAATWYAWSGVL